MRAKAAATAPPTLRGRYHALAAPHVDELVAAIAGSERVSPRALRLKTLLHLPRVAAPNGLVDHAVAAAEAERLAARLRDEMASFAALAAAPAAQLTSPAELEVGEADAETARLIEERFHYIGSFRRDAVAFAARAGSRLAALATVSPLDLGPIIATLPFGLRTEQVSVVSRVFAFDWAPRNTITYLLARVARAVSEQRETELLLTYLNPNLGFTGASYRAANWALYAREHGTRYAYLDRDYITDRKLHERFGSANPDRLRGQLGGRLEFSRIALAPLELYALFIDARLRAKAGSLCPFELERPEL